MNAQEKLFAFFDEEKAQEIMAAAADKDPDCIAAIILENQLRQACVKYEKLPHEVIEDFYSVPIQTLPLPRKKPLYYRFAVPYKGSHEYQDKHDMQIIDGVQLFPNHKVHTIIMSYIGICFEIAVITDEDTLFYKLPFPFYNAHLVYGNAIFYFLDKNQNELEEMDFLLVGGHVACYDFMEMPPRTIKTTSKEYPFVRYSDQMLGIPEKE